MFIKNRFEINTKETDITIKILFFLLISFAIMPDIISINGRVLKLMYLIFILFCLLAIKKHIIVMPPRIINIFYGYAVFLSIIMSIGWGIDRLFFNYLYGYGIIVVVLTFGKKYSEEDWMEILKRVWLFLVIMVLLNDLRQAYRFIEYVKLGLDHPFIKTVVTGGVNLEATWIGIMTLSFFNSRHRWKAFIVSMIFSLVYSSRVGIIANVMVWICFCFGTNIKENKRFNLRKKIFMLLFSGLAIMLIMNFFSDNEVVTSVFTRFNSIGHDSGSLGRMAMWKYVPTLMSCYPFGVGLGNSILALQKVSFLKFQENNLHNIYLQMLCDLGVIGGVYYIFIWGVFVLKNGKKIINSPIACMILTYGILGMLQFKGGETVFFCLLGMYFSNKKNSVKYV